MASKAIGFLNFKFSADLTSFERALKKAQKGFKKFGKWAKKTGKTLSRNLTLPILGLGAVSIKTFAAFEQGMLKVKAVSGATTSEFKALTESAKKLGSTTMFTASEVATLQFELSKLGLDPTAILDSTKAILQLAQATDTELGEAAKTTAVALNSYNLEADEASRISDVMALASSSAAMDMEKFGAALPKVAATARISGDSFELMSAKLQVLADSGLEGSRMGTQLKIIYSKLVSAGLTWDEAMGKIQKSTNKISTAQKIFGENAFNAAIILSENTGKLNEYEQANLNAIGTSKKMADIMDSGVGGAMRRLQSQTEGLLIQLGTALMPVFTKVLDKLSDLVTWFSTLSDETKKNIVILGLILAAIGPVLWIFGQLSIGLGVLVGAFKAVGVFLVTSPWLAAAAGIAAVGYAIYDTFIATNDLVSAQDDLDSISKTAQASIIDEKIAVELLTDELTAQGISLEDKKIALDKLKKISPKYYGSLKIAKGVVEGLDTATKNYTASILQQAKAEAMKQKLIDLNIELLEVEAAIAASQGNFISEALAGTQGKLMKKNIQDRIDALTDEYAAINKVGKARGFWSMLPTPTTTGGKGGNGDNGDGDGDGPDDEDVKNVKDYTRAMDPLLVNIKDYAKTMTVVGASMYKVEYFTRQLTEAQKAHNASIVLFEDIMFSAAMSAANSQENFFQSFIENLKKAIKQLLIQLAIMTVITLMMGGPTMTLAKAFSASKASVLGLAEGGLVTGPTTALIGEGVGTTASNPEVVAPLDKLKQYMGGGNQNIIVEGVLKGNDIYLSNKNTSIDRLRTT
tara:strand:- start:3370 stop:5778 length:2409 start_codon:yes stop_codon:yes gene_type:complete